ncbi:hypothetical protein OOK29_10015 [Streptomyces phaeochromogenes]|uniref:hypothetical protein n=1 Tax=Streptomyces phaeochromogenes TaxID=1923 RepID=UPI00224FA54A|nr:hypothetical protein [Streptomyces phaeochromogenes]MCX5598474.1 hypothetical protein [Streptomyces phaeochromogenes]
MAKKFTEGDRVRVAPHVEGLAGMLGTAKSGHGYLADCPVLLDEDEDQLPVAFSNSDLIKES